jgi:hypothetical protein
MTLSRDALHDPLVMARYLVTHHISVVPFMRGTKDLAYDRLPHLRSASQGVAKPSWSPFRERLPTDAELTAWFQDGRCNIAVVGGAVSGGLVVLDIESIAAYDTWRRFAMALLDDAVIATLPVVGTGQGKHVYFRMPNPVGNRTLAKRRHQAARGTARYEVVAETRGEGGLALAPPSIHPSGKSYTLERGDLGTIPVLTAAQAQPVLDAACAIVEEEQPYTQGRTDIHGDGHVSVIDHFNQRHTVQALLEHYGYQCSGRNGYIRPGGDHASVVVNSSTNRSYHFNTADPLHQETPTGGLYGQAPFSVLCEWECAGDVRQAVKLAAQRLGLAPAPHASTATTAASLAHAAPYLAQAAAALGLGDDQGDTPAWPYLLDQGGMRMAQAPNKDGAPKLPLLLTNFTAAITEEREVDDGEQVQERYTIVATCGNRTRTVDMAREDFEGDGALGRIVAALGARARVNPRAHAAVVRDAIKAFSTDVQSRRTYAHTGWVNGHTQFLFGNGYVNTDGWHADDGAQLPQRLH